MGGQRIDAIAAAQTHFAQRAPDHPAARGNQHLDRFGLHRRQLVDDPHVGAVLHPQQFRHFGAQHHAVARLQHHGLQIAAQRQIAAQHVDHPHARTFELLHLQHRSADQHGIFGDRHFGEVFHAFAIAQHRGHRLPVGQQAAREQRQIQPARQCHGDAQRRNFEQAEMLQPRLCSRSVNQNIGRGADQRDHPAQYGHMAQRDQQF